MTFFSTRDRFVERLQQCAGAPWTVFDAQQQLDRLVLQPLPLVPDSPQADPAVFLEFLANTFHRRLFWCFIGNQAHQQWTLEDLQKESRPPSPQALVDALDLCHFWQIVLKHPDGTWQGHPRLILLNNPGWTFEWVIQALLERDFGALVRRHVILGEIVECGEIDVLALLPDGRSLLVECKSSSKGLTDRQLDRFLVKAQRFPADRALLLIDTDDQHRMQQRVGQLGQAMGRVSGKAQSPSMHVSSGSSLVFLGEQVYVADTGGGVLHTLQTVLAGF